MTTRRKLVTMFAGGGIAHTSGGVGTFIQYLTDEWATRAGTPRVRVIDTRGEGGKAGMIRHFPKAIAWLLYLRATNRIDLVHIHMTANAIAWRKSILILLGNLLGLPVIVHMHGSNFREFYFGLSGPLRQAIRFVLNRARFIIVLGSGWRELLIVDIGVAPEKISVIFNGVPRPVTATAPASADHEAVRIVFLGQLGERKGVPDLLEALRSPLLQSRRWTATIAGDGAVDEFRAAVATAGLRDRVTLPGWVDRRAASDLLQQADIFVLPSLFEAMPIAILEALAHGVAVIATPVGAIPEFLTDGRNAILVPPSAPAELAKAMARLIDDRNERIRLGAAGQTTFRQQFDISVAADRILAVYAAAAHSLGDPTQGTKVPHVSQAG